MNPHPVLENDLNWLLNHSLQAGVLVLLVLLGQRVFRRQLTSRWRFALWWIVLIRLLLPFGPQSSLSVFNFFSPYVKVEGPRYSAPAPIIPLAKTGSIPAAPAGLPPVQNEPAQVKGDVAPAPSVVAMNAPPQMPETAPIPPAAIPIPAVSRLVVRPPTLSLDDYLIPGLAGLWLAGVLVLVGMVARQLVKFNRRLARASAPADPRLQELLDDCRREFGLARRIELLETEAVQSPALFGLVRPRLLLPRGMGGQFSERELRYIFLHELAHVKRGDLWLNWLVTALQIMHWFNPLLWLGFARLRADRELACDELALLRAGDQAGTAYGETVVKLLENLSRPATIPGLVGILEDKKQMRRRISMIANFRKPGRWSVLAVFLLTAMAAAALTDAQSGKQPPKAAEEPGTLSTNAPAATPPATLPYPKLSAPGFTNSLSRADLTGTVSAEGGAPLPAPATVFIATAAPKTGSSTFCPSCYADCSKHAQTDAAGGFAITSLDSQLTFQLLAVAKGCQPKYVSKVDPLDGTPVKIELDPIEAADAAPGQSLRGRVVNQGGRPVAGAVVDVQGWETRNGGGMWGTLPGIDPRAVTDENGDFLITSKKPFELLTVRVSARTYAEKNFNRLSSGAERHDLVLTEGAALKGRVLLDGKPVGGVSAGVSGTERQSGVFLGHFEVGTTEQGEFLFLNLPPDGDFQLYTVMRTMKQSGAVPEQRIHTARDGETTDAGDLAVAPAHRLAGRVVLADGQPVPPKTRLLIARDDVWDSTPVMLPSDGTFDAAGIPDETVTVSVRVKGYHLSAQNLSVDLMNPFRLIGRVDRDLTNLVIKLEPGPDPRPDYSHIDPEYAQLRTRTLRGAESAPDHSRDWLVAGQVLDRETKQPIQNFQATPGQKDDNDQTSWSTLRAVAGTNGWYVTYVSKRVTQPLLKVEAEGYLPTVRPLYPLDSTNVDISLQKGSGPAGRVVMPDGKPAAGAGVVLLDNGSSQAGLSPDGELTGYANRAALHIADTNGDFAFKPVWGMRTLVAASANGFAQASVAAFATNATLVLQPYGKISGTLQRGARPGTNESLGVMFAGPDALRVNLYSFGKIDTGKDGRFSFDRVPPGHLQIYSSHPLAGPLGGSGATTSDPVQEVDVLPGQSLAVNITAAPRETDQTDYSYRPPSPKPVPGEQIKGVVLLPDGQPAVDADVALQVEGMYLGLGRAAFSGNGRNDGTQVSAGADGSFTLPLYTNAQSVIALNEAGYAQVSLEQLKTQPTITLQKWGRIEGTLRIGHHPGTNELVSLSGPPPRWSKRSIRPAGSTNTIDFTNTSPVAPLPPPLYDSRAFEAKTDDQGRFAIAYVPPGERSIARMIPTGEHSWTHSRLGSVLVKPGETTVTNFGGTGRTVTGKITFTGDAPPDLKKGGGAINTPIFKLQEKGRQLKTDAERKAFYSSPELQAMLENHRSFPVTLAADGSFRAEDVLPGKYEFDLQPGISFDEKTRTLTSFSSVQDFVVPDAKDQNDDSPVEVGTLELKKFTQTIPGSAPVKTPGNLK
ncbi:MAG: M56 family metallopeptidase [Verrucomicrobiae bacterium]|nr:M56 family metallopeptidase [Verrucomicrobiae bacterium]